MEDIYEKVLIIIMELEDKIGYDDRNPEHLQAHNIAMDKLKELI